MKQYYFIVSNNNSFIIKGPPLDVAVKMLKVDSNLTEEQRNEFLQEMTTMAQLQHKFILRQHAVVIDPLVRENVLLLADCKLGNCYR